MSIGNDVVDLADPETFPERLHPRFDARVFAPNELALLRASASPRRLRWSLWAAKEAAYKACARLEAELVFSPRKFEVAFDVAPGTGECVSGVVRHRGRTLAVELHESAESVHAIARAADAPPAQVLSEVDVVASDPSRAVRELASRMLGSMC